MKTYITASTKPEYPVIDRNPSFTKVAGNFNILDYLRLVTITGVSITVGYLSGIKPRIRGPSTVTWPTRIRPVDSWASSPMKIK